MAKKRWLYEEDEGLPPVKARKSQPSTSWSQQQWGAPAPTATPLPPGIEQGENRPAANPNWATGYSPGTEPEAGVAGLWPAATANPETPASRDPWAGTSPNFSIYKEGFAPNAPGLPAATAQAGTGTEDMPSGFYDPAWWSAFKAAHGGQNMVDFYMAGGENKTPQAAITAAMRDRGWGEKFAATYGRPPSEADWRYNWFVQHGLFSDVGGPGDVVRPSLSQTPQRQAQQGVMANPTGMGSYASPWPIQRVPQRRAPARR
jgi:hypothetical protein